MALLCPLLAGLTALRPARAQTWQPLPVHGGGYITGLVVTPADTNKILARCDVAGVFRSDNRGDGWRNLTATLPKYDNNDLQVRSLVADDSFNNLLYLCGGAPYGPYSRLWQTSTGGTSWQSQPLPFSVAGNGYLRSAGETLWRNPTNANDLVAAGQPVFDYATTQWKPSAGLFRSTNGGLNWQKIGGSTFEQANVAGLKPQPGSGNDVFYLAVVRETMYGASTLNQGLWRWVRSTNALTQVLSGEDVVDFDFDAGQPNRLITTQAAGIRVSSDGGLTWSALQQPFGYAYEAFVTAHPTEAGHWYFGSWSSYGNNALVETRNGGATFTQTRYNSPGNRAQLSYPPAVASGFRPSFANASSQLLLHPTRPNLVYTADWYGVWRSTNAAGPLLDPAQPVDSNARWRWTYAATGIHNVVTLRVNRVPGSPGQFYMAIADMSYFRSADAGATMTWDPTYYMNNVYAVGFARHRPSMAYLVGTYYENGNKLVKSTNGGQTFGPVSGFLNAAACVNDVVVSGTGDTLVCGVDRGSLASPLYISYNGGQTWAAWAQGLPWTNIFRTWEGVSHLLSDADGKTVYVWRDNAIYRRRWADAAWQAVPPPAEASSLTSVKTDYAVPGKLYLACGKPSIYSTTNGGATWATIATPGSYVDGFAVADDGQLLARESADASRGRAQALYLYRPATGTWTTTATSQVTGVVDDIEFVSNDVAVAWSHNTGAYRLVLGTALTTPLAAAFPDAASTPLGVYPNPATGPALTAYYEAPATGPVTLQLLDVLGRVLLTRTVRASAGPNRLPLALPPTVPNGASTLRLIAADGQVLHRALLVLR